MKNKPDVIYCQMCSRKTIVDDTILEIKLNNVPGGIPYIDKEDGKVKMPSLLPRRRIYKCPGCGRGVASKMLTTTSPKPTVIYDGDFRNSQPQL